MDYEQIVSTPRPVGVELISSLQDAVYIFGLILFFCLFAAMALPPCHCLVQFYVAEGRKNEKLYNIKIKKKFMKIMLA